MHTVLFAKKLKPSTPKTMHKSVKKPLELHFCDSSEVSLVLYLVTVCTAYHLNNLIHIEK